VEEMTKNNKRHKAMLSMSFFCMEKRRKKFMGVSNGYFIPAEAA